MRIRTRLLARIWLRVPAVTVALDAEGLRLEARGREVKVAFDALHEVTLHPRGFWAELRLCAGPNDWRLRAAGLPRRRARRLVRRLQMRLAAGLAALSLDEFRELLSRNDYLRRSDLRAWQDRARSRQAQIVGIRAQAGRAGRDGVDAERCISRLDTLLTDAEHRVDQRNDIWVEKQLARHLEWLDAVERHPLTARQRDAVVRAEDHNLVVAGPGTGKTSTVVGKVRYLVEICGVPEQEVLVLSFSRKAVEELDRRFGERGSARPVVRTFHALGLEILGEVEGMKPSLSRLAEDEDALADTIGSWVDELVAEQAPGAPLRSFLLEHLRPFREPAEFSSRHRYIQHLRGQHLRTLQGELVKSQEELVIANWLFSQGIEYEYEAKYAHPTATKRYAQYRPDFHLPGPDIYLEHFGVDREGNPAPGIDAESYRAGMEWKRSLHAEHGTELVETRSYEAREGSLLANLDARLRALGVEPSPISAEALCAALGRQGETRLFVKLVGSFLNLFKSQQRSLDELRAGLSPGQRRERLFLDLLEGLLSRYERHLAEEREIDFHDMIGRALHCIEEQRWQSPYSWVVVDEFQDIACARQRLIRALVDSHPQARTFCVGDDCQSVYRFTGSNIGLMTRFEEHFGFARRTELDRSFRLNDRLLDLAVRFVGRNPAQLPKRMEANARVDCPAVSIHTLVEPEHGFGLDAKLDAIFVEIGRRADSIGIGSPSLLVIGRYHFTKPKCLGDLAERHPEVDARFVTAHGSKGLEADFVVIVDVVSGRYGFPCEIFDDPLLDLVLCAEDSYPNAEERRLLFVALTRARHHAWLLTSQAHPSSFVLELGEQEYAGLVDVERPVASPLACAECGADTIVVKQGPYGDFWGCLNFPYCRETLPRCPDCQEGALVSGGPGGASCSHPDCDGSARPCPRCRSGVLLRRTGPYGSFLGCSSWSRVPSCDHTENAY